MKESESSEWMKRKVIKKEKIYECGCGKRYKVYNSLELHIKGVHNGVVRYWAYLVTWTG